MTKTILEVGESGSGKPGKPYIINVSLLGYFAPEMQKTKSDSTVTKSVDEKHERFSADDISGRGEVFVDHTDKPINLTLGDDRLPYGLWKSMEHMRKGEKSRIMIKPKSGYNHPKFKDTVFFPRGWDTEEKKEILRKRRVFFEITLHDWTVRHDIMGDGLLVKTLLKRGRGFDRPSQNDFVKFDIKIYQREQVFLDQTGVEGKVP